MTSRTNLLAKANARACVEGDEDVRVVRQVLVEALVDEAVRVEFGGCARHQGPT